MSTQSSTDPTPAAGSQKTDSRGSAEGLSQGQIVRKRFFAHTPAVISMIVLAFVFILAFTSVGFDGGGWFKTPGWWKYNWIETSPTVNNGAPSLPWSGESDHLFGQDRVGRDYFAMTMRGTQISLIVMLIAGLVAGLIGIVVGGVAGYFRGWVEAVLMRLTDVVIILPLLVIAAVVGRIVLRIATEQGWDPMVQVYGLGLFLGLVVWTTLARLIRAEFLTLREREFVDAARIAGASSSRIIFKHILPNTINVITVNITLLMSAVILTETALSYLSLGVQFPNVSLGGLISENQQAFATRPWLFWFPGLFIILICLSINFIGDGLRDAFDPRQKKFNARKAKTVAPGSAAAAQAEADYKDENLGQSTDAAHRVSTGEVVDSMRDSSDGADEPGSHRRSDRDDLP